MTIAYITVEKVDKEEVDYVHFNDRSQKAWNCTNADLFSLFSPGNRIKVDFNTTKPKDSTRKPSRYINNARLANDSDPKSNGMYDSDNSLLEKWPDKEAYKKGGNKTMFEKKDDYDPEVGKRQTASNVAGRFLSEKRVGVEEFKRFFPEVAEVVYNWINQKPDATFPEPSESSDEEAGGDDDIPF